jgi:hypothetical protein
MGRSCREKRAYCRSVPYEVMSNSQKSEISEIKIMDLFEKGY